MQSKENPDQSLSYIQQSVAKEKNEITNLPDDLARQEANQIAENLKRGEDYRKIIHFFVKTGLKIIGWIFLVLITVRAYHLVVPDCIRWLNSEEIISIERIIFSGIIISLSSKYFKKFNLLDDK